MKIGILKTNAMDFECLSHPQGYSGQFENWLGEAEKGHHYSYFDVLQGQWPDDTTQADLWLITGARESAYDDLSWIHRLKDFVRQCHQHQHNLLGICFGHQVVAEALGGQVQKSERGMGLGVRSSQTDQQTWLESRDCFALFYSHFDQVMRLPDQAQCLSASDFCQIESYRLDHHILCFQGHPEYNQAMMREDGQKYQSKFSAKQFEKIYESFSQPTDQGWLAAEVLNHFRR